MAADTLLSEFFLSFGLLSIFALVGGLLSARWRQPTVVGLLVVGAIIGPNSLGIVRNSEVIKVFSELGAALLLFSIGVEFSLAKISGSGLRSLLVSSGIMFFGFLAGYEAGVLLGLGPIISLALGSCFAFSSTAIFVRTLTQNNLLSQAPIPLLVSVLVIEDIAAVAAITFFSSIKAESGPAGAGVLQILLSIAFSLAVLGFVYLLLKRMLGRAVSYLESYKSDEHVVLLALGLCITLALVAGAIGLSPSIGAFLAGSIAAGLPIRHEIERTVSPFSLAFSSFFFLSAGLMISPHALLSMLPVVAALSILFIIIVFLSSAFFTYLAGFELEDAVLAGAAMAVMGEFSLLLATQAAPIAGNFDIITAISSIVLISTISSAYLLSIRPRITNCLRSRLSPSGHSKLAALREYIKAVLSEFEGGGAFLARAKATFRTLVSNMTSFVIVFVAVFLLRRAFSAAFIDVLGIRLYMPTLIAALAIMLLLPSAFSLLGELRLFADALSAVFVKFHKGGERTGRRIARDFFAITLLLIIILLIPITIDLLSLPNIFHLLVLFPALFVLLVGWDAASSFLGFAHSKASGNGGGK